MSDTTRFDRDDALNHAIDLVAARMTSGGAPPDLRARVLDRLPAHPAYARSRWISILAPLAAVAAVIVAAIVWTHRSHSAVVTTGPSPMAGAQVAASGVDAPPPVVVPKGRVRHPAPERLVEPGLPVLARPDALTIDAIQPASLAIPQLQVAPIVTERLKMPPVDENGSGR